MKVSGIGPCVVNVKYKYKEDLMLIIPKSVCAYVETAPLNQVWLSNERFQVISAW